MIRARELVAIFDISIEQSSKLSKQFMQAAKEQQHVEIVGEEEVKSIVVTQTLYVLFSHFLVYAEKATYHIMLRSSELSSTTRLQLFQRIARHTI